MQKIVAILTLLMVLVLGTFSPVLAQENAPSQCPYQQACEIIGQAVQLGAQYGITPAQVNQLIPSLVNQDMGAVGSFLTSAGLSPQQQQELLSQAQPLLSMALSNPYLKQSIGALMDESMNNANIPKESQGQVVGNLNDDDELYSILSELGLDDGEIAEFLDDVEYYGYSAAAFDTFLGAYAFEQTLEALGIDEDDYAEFFDAYFGDYDDLERLFDEAGLDIDEAFELWDSAYFDAFDELGFDEDDYDAFQQAVFLDLLGEAALYEDDLANLLELYGFDDDDIEYYLNDLGSLLIDLDLEPVIISSFLMMWAELGYDLDDIGLDPDEFGMFLDMDDDFDDDDVDFDDDVDDFDDDVDDDDDVD